MSNKELERKVVATVFNLIGAFEPEHITEKERQALSDAIDLIEQLWNALEGD